MPECHGILTLATATAMTILATMWAGLAGVLARDGGVYGCGAPSAKIPGQSPCRDRKSVRPGPILTDLRNLAKQIVE